MPRAGRGGVATPISRMGMPGPRRQSLKTNGGLSYETPVLRIHTRANFLRLNGGLGAGSTLDSFQILGGDPSPPRSSSL